MNQFPSSAPDIVTGIVRAILAGGGGWLVNHGLATASQTATLEGASAVLFVGAWSIFANWRQHQKLVAQRAAPAGKVVAP